MEILYFSPLICHANQWHAEQNVNFAERLALSVNYFNALSLSLSLVPLWLSSPFNVAPLMTSGGSVIFSFVPRVSLLPNSSRSSQNSAGPTDRNSLPCRYQSPPMLTIILICLSLLLSLPKPQCLLPTLGKQGFILIVTDS